MISNRLLGLVSSALLVSLFGLPACGGVDPSSEGEHVSEASAALIKPPPPPQCDNQAEAACMAAADVQEQQGDAWCAVYGGSAAGKYACMATYTRAKMVDYYNCVQNHCNTEDACGAIYSGTSTRLDLLRVDYNAALAIYNQGYHDCYANNTDPDALATCFGDVELRFAHSIQLSQWSYCTTPNNMPMTQL
jgi:hypothetical protein